MDVTYPVTGPCFNNYSAETVKAANHEADLRQSTKNSQFQKTDTLAQVLFHILNHKKLIYDFGIKRINIAPPFEGQQFEELFAHPFHALAHLKYLNCLLLIDKNIFKFYFRKMRTEDEAKIYEVKDGQMFEIKDSYNIDCKSYYLIFFSTTCFHYRLSVQERVINNEPLPRKFFNFWNSPDRPAVAPFHHEYQPVGRGLCGMHGVNSYLRCSFFSVNKFKAFIGTYYRMRSKPEPEGDIEQEGLDPVIMGYVIEQVAKLKEVPGLTENITVIKFQVGKQEARPLNISEEKLLARFKHVDRFILGRDGHCINYAKDDQGVWWDADNEIGEQNGYETNEALFNEIIKQSQLDEVVWFVVPFVEELGDVAVNNQAVSPSSGKKPKQEIHP